MKRQRKRMSRSEAIVILVIGLLLGTVFTFGEQFWHAPVDRRELRYVDAAYQRYKYADGGRHNSMTLYFENEEAYDITVECVNDELLQRLDEIQPGTVLHLGVHPNSNTLMEITHHGQPVLTFAQASRRVSFRVRGFLILGLFMYCSAAYGLYQLFKGKA